MAGKVEQDRKTHVRRSQRGSRGVPGQKNPCQAVPERSQIAREGPRRVPGSVGQSHHGLKGSRIAGPRSSWTGQNGGNLPAGPGF